jgi:ribosome maturation factor RimP
MSALREQIKQLVAPIAVSKGAYLIDVVVRGEHGRQIVEIFVDHDNSVTTDLCAEISRELAHVFDQVNILRSRYDLVVSSPGLERPLKLSRQYLKNVGRTIEVHYSRDGQQEKVVGKLTSANEQSIEIMLSSSTAIRILLEQILEARVKPVF